MKPRSEQYCGNCAAWIRGQGVIKVPMPGECHARPPQMIVVMQPGALAGQMQQNALSIFPARDSNSWCLCWQDRETHPLFRTGNGGDDEPLSSDDIKSIVSEFKEKLSS
jgi:hypothetical protein